IATGTGQIANILSSKFSNVYATDISETMLSNALRASNINYSISTAEDLSRFPSSKFDMLTVGQSAHWFKLQEFFEAANRVLIPNGTLAIFGYTFHVIKGYNEISEMLIKFGTEEEISKYWDERRIIINDLYRSFVLPEQFKNVEIIRNEKINGGEISGEIFMEEYWSIDQMANYMKTWSSYKDYMVKNKDTIQQDPVDKLMNKIKLTIGLKPGQKLHIIWPMVLILATKTG
ncbi:2884_t:CDS:2, partial [Dentiscutata erythropus]